MIPPQDTASSAPYGAHGAARRRTARAARVSLYGPPRTSENPSEHFRMQETPRRTARTAPYGAHGVVRRAPREARSMGH